MILRGKGASQRGGRKSGEGRKRFLELLSARAEPILALSVVLGKLIVVTRVAWVQAVSCVYKMFFRASAFLQLFLLQSSSLCKNKSRSEYNFLPNCPERELFRMDGGVLLKFLWCICEYSSIFPPSLSREFLFMKHTSPVSARQISALKFEVRVSRVG